MPDENILWRYFAEIRQAVDEAARGDASQPYRNGAFMVSALAGDVELTVSDISEEDAVLIASELEEMGVKALIRGSAVCPHCGKRVPEQAYCIHCRNPLGKSENPRR